MQLAPSLRRLGRSSLVNSYLLEESGQITIIDAGLPGHWSDFVRELDAMGRSFVDVRAVLLTHGDVDHTGFAERLRREANVPVFVAGEDAAEARGETGKPPAPRDRIRIGPLLQFAVFGATHGGLRKTPLREVHVLQPGTLLDLPGSPRVIPLPGHTPGSVAFHMPAFGALFVGDAMTTRSVTNGRLGPAVAPFTVDRARAAASLAALEGLEAKWLLPGHGDPWTRGVADAVRRARRGEEEATGDGRESAPTKLQQTFDFKAPSADKDGQKIQRRREGPSDA